MSARAAKRRVLPHHRPRPGAEGSSGHYAESDAERVYGALVTWGGLYCRQGVAGGRRETVLRTLIRSTPLAQSEHVDAARASGSYE